MMQDLIRQLDLRPHPEGGHYRETLRLPPGSDGRSRMTAILFLLGPGERSHWHRVDAAELWLWHAGAPLTLAIADEPPLRLGANVTAGERPQALVPADAWQAAWAEQGWALVSCVVAPGFDFAGFELAPPDWQPRG
ncbi:cupin domain-containing protein [Sphingomonas sp. BK345]|uniref:cupin domain-containing protein n=1 Tax=Sphingomonas sp. BK345 TaxID=2586980 RepID=UPI00160EDDFD|nr:cupin domain-containing protein [Sphingomonas sp. BK345]MBB3474087.1 hypothetical protein [Sphingomonas sp. BK345]